MDLNIHSFKFVPSPGFDPKDDTFYHYIPTKSVCIVFIVLFSISTVVHFFEAIRFRTWYLIPTVVLAGTGEILGWSSRYWSSLNEGTLETPFLIQITCTIISPTPLLAGYFILLGKLILLLGQEYSRLRYKWYTGIFLTADIVALTVQAVGGGKATATTNPNEGSYIALGGIAFQLVALAIYILLATEFFFRFHFNRAYHTSSLKPQSEESSQTSSVSETPRPRSDWPFSADIVKRNIQADRRFFALHLKVQLLVIGMALSIMCIFIRAVYRTIELSGGWNGRLNSTQVYFNVLDGAMILLAMWTLNVFHPGFLLSTSSNEA